MKKIVFILMIAAGYGAKAQHLPLVTPERDRLLYDLDNSRSLSDSLFKLKPGVKTLGILPAGRTGNDIVIYSRMPVAPLQRSGSKMPVADLSDNFSNMRYTMLIKKVDVINPDSVGLKRIMP